MFTTTTGLTRRATSAGVAVAALAASCIVAAPAAQAIPHGCASVSSDHSVAFEPVLRRAEVRVNTDEPCTFIYAPGDVFSGSGRYTVSCSTGGYDHHPDGEPPDVATPIPQPCAPGATVTLNGYHPFSGGAVVGGGLSTLPPLPSAQPASEPFQQMCAPGTASATVAMLEPVDRFDRAGILTYRGDVRCDGADIDITSLTVTPFASYTLPSAGAASCDDCSGVLSVVSTIPARSWVYDVKMDFAVSAGGETAHGTRLGRYVIHWGGVVTTLCPGTQPWGNSDPVYVDPVQVTDSCPV